MSPVFSHGDLRLYLLNLLDEGPRHGYDIIQALSDRTDVLLVGGPTLAGAFLRAGVIDRILAYIGPILLGGPVTAIDDVGVLSIAHAQRWRFDGVDSIGPDVLLSLVPG